MMTLASDRETPPVATREAMERRVAADVLRHFGDRAPESELLALAGEAVAHLWSDDIAVTAFIPALAIREVKERLRFAATPVIAR